LKLKEKYRDVDLIISHWDTDGIISSCMLARGLGLRIDDLVLSSINASVSNMVKYMKKGYSKIAILDLNMPEKELANHLSKVLNKKNLPELLVIDHHPWNENSVTMLSAYSSSREIIIEPEYPSTARIIYEKLLEKDSLTEEETFMVNIADDDDTFTNTYPLTKKLRVVLRWSDWKIRYKVLGECLKGNLWSEWLERYYREAYPKYEQEIEKTLETTELVNLGHMTICFVKPSEKVHPGDIQSYLEEKRKVTADIYLFLYKSGLSIRSARFNVANLAKELGGGGHPKASGVLFESEERATNIKEKLLRLIEKLYK
jgi:nanoRNase/pAp phosphatase (c-di-AMP/oligoRNAs hydrolase)